MSTESKEHELIEEINKSNAQHVVSTILKTDERVIARVTDGIYRQPGASLRELISNAYDADASRVVIKTDAPRFERIEIEDNGQGMTPDALAYLLLHIGGSAKRNTTGKELGITSNDNPLFSPGGRRLIGKIGIGLFSVSQLTHTFQIITKIKNDSFRTIATVALKQYTDDNPKENGFYESGKVNIWREKASDKSSHGTTIVLTGIKPQARSILQSREIWSIIDQNEINLSSENDELQSLEPPKFHIGHIDTSGNFIKGTDGKYSSLPWQRTDSPCNAFKKLVRCVWDETENANPNPQLERIFDYYLRMIWQLSLSIPVSYVEEHLFDIPLKEWEATFEISNKPKGMAKEIEVKGLATTRQILSLTDTPGSAGKFEVFLDDLQLLRPIRYKGLPATSHAIKKPLVFIGKCREEFSGIPRELSGGSLDFEAYLFWTPKVAPTEHQGALVRIYGSSGTLFDSTFMRYQVSEQTRLRQTTCEIFIKEGLDSALNIDRESFNNAHPHYVYITKWIHNSLRQLATSQKRIASKIRELTRTEEKDTALSEIQNIAFDIWKQESKDPDSTPPSIEIVNSEDLSKSKKGEKYVFQRNLVEPESKERHRSSGNARREISEQKLKAIAQILASFGLLDSLTEKKREKLLKAIYMVLEASE